MRTNISKRLLFFLVAVVCLICRPVQAFAEDKEVSITLGDGYEDAVFYVTWDGTDVDAAVTITSPSGKTYSKSGTPEVFTELEGTVMVYAGAAEAGEWKVKVSGTNVGRVDVSAGELPDSLTITSFDVRQNADGTFSADYSITDCPDEVQIEIYADTDSMDYDGERVCYEYGGPSGTLQFDMNGQGSGEYHFYIYVTVDGIYSQQYADTVVSYQRPGGEKVAGVKGGIYNSGYYITWNAAEGESYTVKVWDESFNLIAEEVVDDADSYYDSFIDGETKAYLAVTKTYGDCDYDLITADSSASVDGDVVYDIDGKTTNKSFMGATITMGADCSFEAFLDGDMIMDTQKEAGMYRISLSEGDNEVVIVVTDKAGNAKEFTKNIYVDTSAPQLSISDDLNGMVVTDDYVYVGGYSESGATVTVNGEAVELTQSYFNVKVALNDGENTITVKAEDIAGNQSVYTAVVTRSSAQGTSRLIEYIILGALFVVLLVVYICVFVRKRKARNSA